MMEAVAAGDLDAIVAFAADCLTRKPRENEDFIDYAERHGLELATVTGHIDLSTAIGRMAFRQLGAVARLESELRSERMRSKHRQLAVQGRPSGGHRSFGYALIPGQDMVIVPEEAALIREAAQRIIAGETLNAIATDWHRRGIQTVRDGRWKAKTLRQVLGAPRTAGLRYHNGALYSATWEPILDRETHEHLKILLTLPGQVLPGKRRRSGDPVKFSYLNSLVWQVGMRSPACRLTCPQLGSRLTLPGGAASSGQSLRRSGSIE